MLEVQPASVKMGQRRYRHCRQDQEEPAMAMTSATMQVVDDKGQVHGQQSLVAAASSSCTEGFV